MRVAYYRWLWDFVRFRFYLACAQVDPQQLPLYLSDARNELKSMRKLVQPTFAIYTEALKLVVDAAAGQVAAVERWQATLQAAEQHGLNLLVAALRWHAAQWHATENGEAARQQLIDQGCVNPQRLMNVILPLPRA